MEWVVRVNHRELPSTHALDLSGSIVMEFGHERMSFREHASA